MIHHGDRKGWVACIDILQEELCTRIVDAVLNTKRFARRKTEKGTPLMLDWSNRTRTKTLSMAFAVFLLTFIFIARDLGDYGVTWDEAYPNFEASLRQAEWFRQLPSMDKCFSEETIDQYWKTTSDHPSLARTLSALSYLMFSRLLGIIPSLRLPNALWFSILAAAMFYWLANNYGIASGLASTIALLLLPRMFGHAHIASLDLPVTVLWFLTMIVYLRGLEDWRWGIATGLVYGLAITTKLHAFFLPFPLMAWTIWRRHRGWYRPLIPMAVISPLLYLGLQPWLWHHTWQRLVERFFHYAGKSVGNPIRLFYLGTLYSNDTPWHYAFVMILFTVPLLTFLLFLLGVYRAWSSRRQEPLTVLLLLNFLVPPCLLLLPRAQGYDGTRLFMECFPYLACLAGIGAKTLLDYLQYRFRHDRRKANRIAIELFFLWTAPIVLQMVILHPFQISYYSEAAGSLPGAKRIGMESTYWCETLTPDLLQSMNEILPANASVVTMSMSAELLPLYQQLGMLRPDLRLEQPGEADFVLLQCRQGMFARMEWYYYLTREPVLEASGFGVPMMMMYQGNI